MSDMNRYTVEGTCPVCYKVFEMQPDTFVDYQPVSGICPHCRHRLHWMPEDCWIKSFMPDDMKESEVPEVEITFTSYP